MTKAKGKRAGHPGPIVRPFRKGDRHSVAQLVDVDDFVLAVDPGAHGMACLFPRLRDWSITGTPPHPIGAYPFRSFDGFNALSEVVDTVFYADNIATRMIVVMEESFAGGRGNAATDIVLARYAGAVIGALSTMTRGNLFDVVFVMPSAWLSAITGKTGRGTKREERKALAKAHAEHMLGVDVVAKSAGLAPHREAYCDVYGIATWWGCFSRESRPDLYGTR